MEVRRIDHFFHPFAQLQEVLVDLGVDAVSVLVLNPFQGRGDPRVRKTAAMVGQEGLSGVAT